MFKDVLSLFYHVKPNQLIFVSGTADVVSGSIKLKDEDGEESEMTNMCCQDVIAELFPERERYEIISKDRTTAEPVPVHVFKIYEGGVRIRDEKGQLQIYETILDIIESLICRPLGSTVNKVDGKVLIGCRASQVETIRGWLDSLIRRYGRHYTYTTDPEYWDDPNVAFILLPEDNLVETSGKTIPNLTHVILMTGSNPQNFATYLQCVFRVIRLNQVGSRVICFFSHCQGRTGDNEKQNCTAFVEYFKTLGHNLRVHDVNAKYDLNVSPFYDESEMTNTSIIHGVTESAFMLKVQAEFSDSMRMIAQFNRTILCTRYNCASTHCHYAHKSNKILDYTGKGRPYVISSKEYRLSRIPNEGGRCRNFTTTGICKNESCTRMHYDGFVKSEWMGKSVPKKVVAPVSVPEAVTTEGGVDKPRDAKNPWGKPSSVKPVALAFNPDHIEGDSSVESIPEEVPKQRYCFEFAKSGTCSRGDKCKYIHCPLTNDKAAEIRIEENARKHHKEHKVVSGEKIFENHFPTLQPKEEQPKEDDGFVEVKGKHREDKPITVPNTQKSICKHYLRGECTYGSQCRFEHPSVCKHFLQGRCTSKSCKFAHPVPKSDGGSVTSGKPKQICREYEKGTCKYGANCRFKHL